MKCDKCGSERLLDINAKCSDLFSMRDQTKGGNGYVPTNLFFGAEGSGDYVRIEFCLDCGKIQGEFPVSQDEVDAAFEKLEMDA